MDCKTPGRTGSRLLCAWRRGAPRNLLAGICQRAGIPTRASNGGKRADFAQNALRVIEEATGETLKPSEGKNPHAQALSALGASRGGKARAAKLSAKKRASIASVTAATKECGDPDPGHIPTGYAERQNLNMRMGMRRSTRVTNAFSKKVENHEHMIAMYYAFYNFARVHQTLKTTPP